MMPVLKIKTVILVLVVAGSTASAQPKGQQYHLRH